MQRTRIKICGVMRAQDAVMAAEAGADAIGMVFYSKAKRCIDLKAAKEIIRALPPFVTPVGLFVNAGYDEICGIADELHLTHVQLHGQEMPELAARLARYSVLKAICADRASLVNQVMQWRAARLPNVKAFVLETPNTGLAGGSGMENNWPMIAEFARDGLFDGGPALIAAGGLNAENVRMVVKAVRPWAVDVSSGVEDKPGKKTIDKIRAFISEVRKID